MSHVVTPLPPTVVVHSWQGGSQGQQTALPGSRAKPRRHLQELGGPVTRRKLGAKHSRQSIGVTPVNGKAPAAQVSHFDLSPFSW